MRISDWSSDVCSSDLRPRIATWIKRAGKKAFMLQRTSASRSGILLTPISAPANPWDGFSTFQRSVDDPLQDDIEYLSPESAKMAFALVIFQIGRASCRERVCQYV